MKDGSPAELEQANIVLGLPGLSFKDPGYYPVHLYAHILGGGLTSRLWHEVRETRGLAYSIDAFHWPFSDCGLFGIGAGTAGSDVAELMKVTLACMHEASATISEIEMLRAKAQMKVALLTALNKLQAAASNGWPGNSCRGTGSCRARRSSPRSMR